MVAPVIRQRPRRRAARKRQSAALPCTEEKTRALVVPWLTSLSRKLSAAASGMVLGGVSRFLGEGEAIEPFEQVMRGRRQHAVLREVNVCVDQSRQDDLAVIAVARSLGVLPRQVGEGAVPEDAAPLAHDHSAVVVAAHRLVGADEAGIVPEAHCAAAQNPRCGIGARRHPAT